MKKIVLVLIIILVAMVLLINCHVKVREKVKGVNGDIVRPDYIEDSPDKKAEQSRKPTFLIKELKFENKKLILSIQKIHGQDTEKEQITRIVINICITNSAGKKVFERGKTVTLINLFWMATYLQDLEKGKYDIIVDVKDYTTGEAARKCIQSEIS